MTEFGEEGEYKSFDFIVKNVFPQSEASACTIERNSDGAYVVTFGPMSGRKSFVECQLALTDGTETIT